MSCRPASHVAALNAHGVHDVQILTNRALGAIASPIHPAEMLHFDHDHADPRRSPLIVDNGRVPLAGLLSCHRDPRPSNTAPTYPHAADSDGE